MMSLSNREDSSIRLDCKPGDLPDCGTGNEYSGSRGLIVPKMIDTAYNPTTSVRRILFCPPHLICFR